MLVSRARFVVAMVALAGGFAGAVVACSSDRPPPASGPTGSPGGGDFDSGTVGIGPGGDAATDAADASDEASLPSCFNDQPWKSGPGYGAGGAPICPTSGTCATYCADVVAHYKVGVAQAAADCILKLPSCSTVLDVNLCIDNAVLAACPDNTSAGFCTPLVPACDPNAGQPGSLIDERGCEAVAQALSAGGRTTFASCIQSKIDAGTCPNDVHLCNEQLRE